MTYMAKLTILWYDKFGKNLAAIPKRAVSVSLCNAQKSLKCVLLTLVLCTENPFSVPSDRCLKMARAGKKYAPPTGS